MRATYEGFAARYLVLGLEDGWLSKSKAENASDRLLAWQPGTAWAGKGGGELR